MRYRLLRVVVLASGALAVSAAQSQTLDQDRERCQKRESTVVFAACTAVIRSGDQVARDELVQAFSNRAFAYAHLGRYQRAIHDYDESIRLKPDDARAFYNRGKAKRRIGDMAGGNADIARAVKLSRKP